ncbi:MAG: hypothetical protein N2043_01685 [Ignavibacterium sp.]|nr:hypothetical protein [Ignavibacterium sp.]
MILTQQQKNEILANEIIEFLKKHHLWYDVALYFNNKKVSSYGGKEETTKNINVKDYLEYCNPDTITMTFEGPLYKELNGYSIDSTIYDKFVLLLRKHGYYFEFGHAWSLSIYSLN